MKMLKKLFAFVAAFAMLLALPTTVLADETKTYVISAPANGHTYEIYQIFTGDYSMQTLSNIKWGSNAKSTYKVNDNDEEKIAVVGELVPQDVIDSLLAVKEDTSDLEKLAVIEKYADLTGTPVATLKNEGKETDQKTYNAQGGYYLIKDKDGTVPEGTDAYTTYVVQVVGSISITPKSDVPTSQKKVKDTNDTTGTTSDWQDSADYDIGDTVPFQLTGTVASNYDAYKVYKFTFHDQESEGLTFNKDSVKVYVDVDGDRKEISSDYYTVVADNPETKDINESPTDGHTFDVVFNDLKQIKGADGKAVVQAGSVITVEYTSTLNNDAVIGSEGNPNVMHLEFSNNPNDDQGGDTGTTPDDKVIVFTYKTTLNKVDEEGEDLKGAEFTLEKKVLNSQTNKEEWITIQTIKNENGSTFEFKGLDDGTYRLSEKAPAGYNNITPIEFTITAEHEILSNDPKLTKMEVKGTNVFNIDMLDGSTNPAGSISANIINRKGTILPSTGGIGTTVFYVTGAILMLGAGVLLVSRKRVSK